MMPGYASGSSRRPAPGHLRLPIHLDPASSYRTTRRDTMGDDALPRVDYRTEPGQYRHWRLEVEGEVARLHLDVAEDGGIQPGYKLKLNSYDLGVDIELHDALNRIRFEHPQVRSVIVTS